MNRLWPLPDPSLTELESGYQLFELRQVPQDIARRHSGLRSERHGLWADLQSCVRIGPTKHATRGPKIVFQLETGREGFHFFQGIDQAFDVDFPIQIECEDLKCDVEIGWKLKLGQATKLADPVHDQADRNLPGIGWIHFVFFFDPEPGSFQNSEAHRIKMHIHFRTFQSERLAKKCVELLELCFQERTYQTPEKFFGSWSMFPGDPVRLLKARNPSELNPFDRFEPGIRFGQQ